MKSDLLRPWLRAAVHGLLLAGIFFPLCSSHAADPFAENVRPTPALTPEAEQKSFKLPPGFEMQLVVAEPDILKPMNMAFDAQGRLWVTVTEEYPYAAPLDRKGRDKIVVLEDNNNDGRADRVTTFADGLNIPIGLYPYKNGVIAWSIPNIWFLQDTDGDGKADKRDVLFGPLGYERDTHGMNASFRRGFDGWVYATHGYNNNSTPRGRDGSSITMNSGNTYRIQADGSRVEQHTWGQVNPFGMCFDALGNLYSADCHSAPVYQLLEGGYYPSFGKPHDGLGFAPTMMEHSHGSTAICGISYYVDDLFPPEYRDNVFIGNVMTSRVNRDTLTEAGSTKVAREMPDLVSTEDPWFRPVDIQLGPDGAIYIADFYNRIIGHYEVPLTHPGRDRTSGRIWRLVYRGVDGKANARPRRDLSRADAGGLVAALGDPNLTQRMLAMNELVDRVGASAVAPIGQMLRSNKSNDVRIAHGLWVLHRLGALESGQLETASTHASRVVRTHVMRILAARASLSEALMKLARSGLNDTDAFVQRSAAEALSRHRGFANIELLLRKLPTIAPADTHTLYVIRKALRDQLLDGRTLSQVMGEKWTSGEGKALADVALGVKSPEAGSYLLHYVQNNEVERETLMRHLAHIARYLPANGVASLAAFIRQRFGSDEDFQANVFNSIEQGLRQQGAVPGPELKEWGQELAQNLLRSANNSVSAWANTPVENAAESANPWVVQKRDSADGVKNQPFLCSLPSGEKLTGMLRSKDFTLPAELKFFLAGHDGFPDKPAQKKNSIRLRDTETGAVLMETFPPRNDLAQEIRWNLSTHAGKSGYLEIVDGDAGSAYAWLAAGRFAPTVVTVPAVNPSSISQRRIMAADLVGKLALRELEVPLLHLFRDKSTDSDSRAAAARALLRLNPEQHLLQVRPLMVDGSAPSALREQIGQALGEQSSPAARALLMEAVRSAPMRLQSKLALVLSGNAEGAETLLQAVAAGQIPARLLLERPIRDKILAAKPRQAEERVKQLTQGLTPTDEKMQKLVETRRQTYVPEKSSVGTGQRVFTQSCSACHQVDRQGGLVGPQLDGIGNRGLERLVEDILDPNRNVDRAFRSTLFVLKDGDVVSGLFRREEGELLILADSTGKEISLAKNTVAERKESETSLMPENFGEILSAEDFNHLLAFLLARKAEAAP